MEIKDLICNLYQGISGEESHIFRFSEDMLPELSAYLKGQGISGLYCHRRKCLKKRRKGRIL